MDEQTVDEPAKWECRRSTRKKILKFDVRDLLNKSRKGRKLQPDPKAAPVLANDGADAGAASPATAPPPPPPLPPSPSSPEQTEPSAVAKKRGRPRKVQPLPLPTALDSNWSHAAIEQTIKIKSKLRVLLKRITMPATTRQVSADSPEPDSPESPDKTAAKGIDDLNIEQSNIETEITTVPLPAGGADSDSPINMETSKEEQPEQEENKQEQNKEEPAKEEEWPKKVQPKEKQPKQEEPKLEAKLARSKRARLRGSRIFTSGTSKKTLEETFAAIAAASSKSILAEPSADSEDQLDNEASNEAAETQCNPARDAAEEETQKTPPPSPLTPVEAAVHEAAKSKETPAGSLGRSATGKFEESELERHSDCSSRTMGRNTICEERVEIRSRAQPGAPCGFRRELAIEGVASGSSSCGLPTPTAELDASEPLKDIAQRLLQKPGDQAEQEETAEEQPPQPNDFAQRVANMETPATTPSPSPSPSPQPGCTGMEESINGAAVRRSHRIKQKPQPLQASVFRGGGGQTSVSSISMAEQLAELAQIEAINAQFLRQEGLDTFQALRDNYYRCARQVSQENAEMQCDCFQTGDLEEATPGQRQFCGAVCINRMLMIECGPLCASGDRCSNKRFQQHQCWPCRVFRTERKGCGVTAELEIPPGEFLMEYVGEVIDSEEFERRQHLYSRDRNRHYYFMALQGEAIIDATAKGNISRYINHSCDPNAETQKWTVNGELRIGFFSVRTIQPGEEITFDYQYQRYGRDAQRCYCEAANCRGWIGGEPDSDEPEPEPEPEAEPEAEELLEADKKTTKAICRASKCIKPKRSDKLRRKQRKEQPKSKEREYKAGRWLRPTASGQKCAARRPLKLEDPDVRDQLALLHRSGLKNQADTLRFSRCMVRARLEQTRLQLLGVLTRGELPCRRLFLDYHGLRLLHGWISESGAGDNQLRLALLESLDSLPIPNRTMLDESRVYQSIQLWSEAEQPQSMSGLVRQLLQKWNALPEVYRIPKRERVEQMKEHERAADGQQQAQHTTTAPLEESNSNSADAILHSDRYRPDRFRRDHTSYRYEQKPKLTAATQLKERNGVHDGISGSASGPSKWEPRRRFDPIAIRSKKLRRSLFERKVALDAAEKRVCSADWRELESRCEYFGAEPKQLALYQNTESQEWFKQYINQLESRKHKENKEKMRRRRELYHRRRIGANMPPHQCDLFSSDEEADVPQMATNCDGFVGIGIGIGIGVGIKDVRVDEPGTLQESRINKPKVKPTTIKLSPASDTATDPVETSSNVNWKRKLPMPQHLSESEKKPRGECEFFPQRRKSMLSSTSNGREACEKFRLEISGHVAEYLRPYRKDNCQLGRITSDEDYKFLTKRLSHQITTKQMHYSVLNGSPLACTESIKRKSFDFINHYMRTKGRVYRKPAEEPGC